MTGILQKDLRSGAAVLIVIVPVQSKIDLVTGDDHISKKYIYTLTRISNIRDWNVHPVLAVVAK